MLWVGVFDMVGFVSLSVDRELYDSYIEVQV